MLLLQVLKSLFLLYRTKIVLCGIRVTDRNFFPLVIKFIGGQFLRFFSLELAG